MDKTKSKSFVGFLGFGVYFLIIGFLLFFSCIFIRMFMFVGSGQIDHYREESNYFEIECEIAESEYSRDIMFKPKEELGLESVDLWDNSVVDAGFWSEVNVGDTVYVVTADGYFWDGYIHPVVAVRTDDKVYLELAAGKQNLIDTLERMRGDYLHAVIPTASVAGALVLTGVTLICVFCAKNRKKGF